MICEIKDYLPDKFPKNMQNKQMNLNVTNNYCKLRISAFIFPSLLLGCIILWLYSKNALDINKYVELQKGSFLYINHNLSQYPYLQNNLTQFGDALVFLSFLGIFVIYAPKIWEVLLSASLVSVLLCYSLKKIFAVPRPAAMIDNDTFVIIGKKLSGSNSLPSGHSVTIFTVLTVLIFAFIPQKTKYKSVYLFSVFTLGSVLAFSRVGVGAHYPIDVITGSIIGYISGLIGIFISTKYKIFNWIGSTKYYPIMLLFFLISSVLLISRIISDNLIVFYLALASVVISIYKIICVYVQK